MNNFLTTTKMEIDCEEDEREEGLENSNPDFETEEHTETLKTNMRIAFCDLLPNILIHVRAPNLLRVCRLVSKSWRDEASSILIKSTSIKTCLKFYTKKDTFCLKNEKSKSKLTSRESNSSSSSIDQPKKLLNELTEMLTSCTSHNFPSTWFSFRNGDLNKPEVLELFSVYGNQIKGLTLDVQYSWPDSSGYLRTNIFPLVPSLQFLEFGDSNKRIAWPEWAPSRAPDQEGNYDFDLSSQNILPLLPCLQNLEFTASIQRAFKIHAILKQIRPLAPNLKRISILKFSFHKVRNFLKKILGFGIPVQIQSASLKIFKPSMCSPQILDGIANCFIKFEILLLVSMSNDWVKPSYAHLNEIQQPFLKILENTKETLKIIYCDAEHLNFLSRLPLTEQFFPKMDAICIKFENVKDRQLKVGEFFPPKFDPSWTNLSIVMPALKYVLLECHSFQGDYASWLPFLDKSAGSSSSVHGLVIRSGRIGIGSGVGTEEGLKVTLKKCTNSFSSLRYLKFEGVADFDRHLTSLEDFVQSVFFHGEPYTELNMEIETEEGGIEQLEVNISAPENPIRALQLKDLIALNFKFESCHGDVPTETTYSTSIPCSSKTAKTETEPIQEEKKDGDCFLKKLVGKNTNYYAFEEKENRYIEMGETSDSDSEDLEVESMLGLPENSLDVSLGMISFRATCFEHPI